MSNDRIHRATSDDGTEIAGRVHGQGPPLVLVHGALADGDTAWTPLLPFLSNRFTCYAMSTRNRGLSGESDDLSPPRLIQDVAAFAESIGEPVGLMGLSGGALLSLGAARSSGAVSAVAAYEPPIFEVITEAVFRRFTDTIARMTELTADGELAGAAQTFVEFVTNEEELASVAEMDFFEALAPNVLVQLREFQQMRDYDGPAPTAPEELAKITAPVLLLHGTRSNPPNWFTDGVDHVASHVTNAHVRKITGAGHLAPIVEPERTAAELTRFLRASEAMSSEPRP